MAMPAVAIPVAKAAATSVAREAKGGGAYNGSKSCVVSWTLACLRLLWVHQERQTAVAQSERTFV